MEALRDLPVAVELSGRLAQEVTAFVEVEAGWQVVSLDGPPRPLVVLAAAVHPGVATVVVVEGTPAPDRVRGELLAGAIDVIGWPADRHRLLEAPLRVRRAEHPSAAPPPLRVAGLSGGVGTSTVALAAAGLLAWAGRRVVVAGGDDLLRLSGVPAWTGPGTVEVAALGPEEARREVAGLARPIAGLDGLAAIGGGGRPVVSTAGWPADTVVTDVGVVGHERADLLVARPDAALRAAASRDAIPDDVAVVIVGDLPLGRRGVRRLLGRAPAAVVASSHRVARAGLAGRIPSALPGSWLAALRPAVTAVAP